MPASRRPLRVAGACLAGALLLLGGCAGLAPESRDIEAKRFEPVTDKAVIYLVRGEPLYSDRPVPVWLGNYIMITTYPDTFFRWEVQPGVHRITGHDTDFGTITVAAEPGRVYFVMQQLSYRHDISYFTMIEELDGRAAVRRALHGWWLVALLLALGGCASTPQATPARDAEAKRFISQPGFAGIYVFRPDFLGGEMDDSTLYVDNRMIGATLPGTFFRIDVQPGPRVVSSSAAGSTQLKLDTRPDELYFVQLNVSSGSSRLALVDPETAKRTIRKCCALMENWAPGQRPLLR